jgi:hypothetical protein
VIALSAQPSVAVEDLSMGDLESLPRTKPRKPRARRAAEDSVALGRSELEQMAAKLFHQASDANISQHLSAESAAESLCWAALRSSAAEAIVKQVAASS